MFKKKWVWLSVILALVSVSLLLPSCSKKTTTTTATATVRRGTVSNGITAVGNLAYSTTQNLAFQLAGYVAAVNVNAGDSVTLGEVIATLDPTAYQNQLQTDQNSVTAAQRKVTAAQEGVPSATLTQLNAQISVNTAQSNLETTQQTSTDPLQIQIAQQKLLVAQMQLQAATNAISDANQAVIDAQNTLAQVQQTLANDQSLSPNVTAPFAGLITTVSVTGGQQVYKGTVAAVLADPNQFQTNINISEANIRNIYIGQNATATMDAVSGVTFPAIVTAITPSATISSGVVNYPVTIEIEPPTLASLLGNGSTSSNGSSGQRQFSGNNSSSFSGNSTGRTFTPGSGNSSVRSSGGLSGNLSSQLQRMVSANGTINLQALNLKTGLTTTISLITSQMTNVLMVPNSAVTSKSGATTVQVVLAGGKTETRTITTGISSAQYTAVLSGLNDGDTVVVPSGSVVSTGTTNRAGVGGGGIGGGGLFIGGR